MNKQFPIYMWTQGTNYKLIAEFNLFGFLIQIFKKKYQYVKKGQL